MIFLIWLLGTGVILLSFSIWKLAEKVENLEKNDLAVAAWLSVERPALQQLAGRLLKLETALLSAEELECQQKEIN